MMMNVRIVEQSRGSWNRKIVATPVGVGAILIGVSEIGVIGTVLLFALALACLFAFFQVFPPFYRRRLQGRTHPASDTFVAEAGLEGSPGIMSIASDKIEFEAREGPIVLVPKDIVVTAELVSVRALLRLTRATLTTTDGSQISFTITAPADLVAQALTSAS